MAAVFAPGEIVEKSTTRLERLALIVSGPWVVASPVGGGTVLALCLAMALQTSIHVQQQN